MGDLQSTKLLLAFGADINALNSMNKTPFDLLPVGNSSTSDKINEKDLLLNTLASLNAKHGNQVKQRRKLYMGALRRLPSISMDRPDLQVRKEGW